MSSKSNFPFNQGKDPNLKSHLLQDRGIGRTAFGLKFLRISNPAHNVQHTFNDVRRVLTTSFSSLHVTRYISLTSQQIHPFARTFPPVDIFKTSQQSLSSNSLFSADHRDDLIAITLSPPGRGVVKPGTCSG